MFLPKLLNIATSPVITMSENESVESVAKLMSEKNIRDVIITTDDKELKIIQSSDLIRFHVQEDDITKKIKEFDLDYVPTLTCEASVFEAMNILSSGYEYVCLVDLDNQLKGIVSYSDLISSLDPKSLAETRKMGELLSGSIYLQIDSFESVKNVLKKMEEFKQNVCIVYEDNIPKGMISRSDIIKLIAKKQDLNLTAIEIASKPLHTIPSSISVENGLKISKEKGYKRIIVADGDKIIGVISQKELISVFYNRWQFFIREQQEELKAAKEEAERANQFKSEFLANMSHEIRTPMTGILGFVEHLAKSESNPDRLKEFKAIKNSGETLLNIINDILDFSKIESGKMDIESHPNDIYELIQNSTAVFFELAKEKNITYKIEIDQTLPKSLLVDETRLKQVIYNLLNNAIKFTHEKGSVTLEVKYLLENKHLLFSVIDTGIGIAKENLSKIFNAFDQEDSSTTRRFGGTGLGLSISSKLVSMMGGELRVESILGKGSRFFFELPAEISQIEDSSKNENISNSDEEDITINGHVLVAEDNVTNQVLMSIVLDELGLTYDIANDGVEAINLFQKNSYDSILMDENMPNMNGIEATKQIRLLEDEKNSKAIPIIAVTANAMAEDRQRFISSGMNNYVSKPYALDDIKNVLGEYL
jgi:signal transduction histidine kinase/ActR/RegA family two-component response regulator